MADNAKIPDPSAQQAQEGRSVPGLLEHLLASTDVRFAVWMMAHRWRRSDAAEIGFYVTESSVADFIAELASTGNPKSILDPTCGSGHLLVTVAEKTGAEVVHGIDISESAVRLSQKLLGDTATVFHGDCMSGSQRLLETYDLIVADPPLNARLPRAVDVDGLLVGFKGNFSDGLICWAASRLSAAGRAVLILPTSFVSASGSDQTKAALAAAGFAVTACIEMPVGIFQGTKAAAQIVVIERGVQGLVFVGQYLHNQEHQNVLLENCALRRNGSRLAQGRLVKWDGFSGYSALEREERIAELKRRTGFLPVPMKAIVIGSAATSGASIARLPHVPNSLYLPLVGKPHAYASQDGVPASSREYVQLQIDPRLADARCVAQFFNQELGQALLESTRVGSTVPRVSISALLSIDCYLQPREVQSEVVKAIDRMEEFRSEFAEIETALWSSGPPEVADLCKRVEAAHLGNRHEDWIETLPFPLASILWKHTATTSSAKEQFEILLKFFEALSEFLAVVHLSAFMSDEALWADQKPELLHATKGLSWDRATFGLWKCVVQYLGKRCRTMTNSAVDVAICNRIYCTNSPATLAMLCAPELFNILDQANMIRNSTSGHGGAIGVLRAEAIHVELFELLQKCRRSFGRTWLGYKLVQPGVSAFKDGIFHYNVRQIVGTRSTPFPTTVVTSIEGMEENALYLLDENFGRGLKLVPLVRVMPSPNSEHNACYFYSRMERNAAHLVSYHFEAGSDVKGEFSDIDAVLSKLRSGGSELGG